jgi:hypothetical protein
MVKIPDHFLPLRRRHRLSGYVSKYETVNGVKHIVPVRPAGAKPPLFFLHIPKTAGTSLFRIFEAQYGQNNSVGHLEYVMPDLLSGAIKTLKVDMVSAHISAALWCGRPGASAYAITTCLRDPWRRLVSHINYFATRTPWEMKAMGQSAYEGWLLTQSADFESVAGLQAYLQGISALEGQKLFDNYQVRMLLKHRLDGMRCDLGTGTIAEALEFLQSMLCYGFANDMDCYLADLWSKLAFDGPVPEIGFHNQASTTILDYRNDLAKEVFLPWYERDAALVMAARQARKATT